MEGRKRRTRRRAVVGSTCTGRARCTAGTAAAAEGPVAAAAVAAAAGNTAGTSSTAAAPAGKERDREGKLGPIRHQGAKGREVKALPLGEKESQKPSQVFNFTKIRTKV